MDMMTHCRTIVGVAAEGAGRKHPLPCKRGRGSRVLPLQGSRNVPQAETCIEALEKLLDGNDYLAGDRLSLADLLLIPVYDYLAQTPEGEKLLAGAPNLRRWWDGVRTRESVASTRPKLG
jgi:glutathione S-transferase